MKKILIASACAITLCFTSCASKQAPDTEVQTEKTPQIEAENDVSSESEKEEAASDQSETDSENEESENSVDVDADTDSDANTEELSAEAFPEPEAIEEPEIITLEPADEVIDENYTEATEPVENEEVPEIIVITDDENEKEEDTSELSENQDQTADINENENAGTQASEDKDIEDISANDIVIEEKSPDTDDITGGIDITDDDSDSGEEYQEAEKEIIPSRSVSLKKFEYLDVTYPGTGWVYMGLTDNSKDLAYFGRKLGTKDTKFTLQARAAGQKIIHFYKNDPLTGQYLDDYIEVIIQAENGSNKTHITAPEFKLPVKKEKAKEAEKAEADIDDLKENENAAEGKTQVVKSKSTNQTAQPVEARQNSASQDSQTSQASKEVMPSSSNQSSQNKQKEDLTESSQTENELSASKSENPATLLQEAQVLYNENEFKAALAKLNQFFEFSTEQLDQALYLKGQILEAKSDARDIKGAIDAYTTLTKNYPASKYWDSANKRIIYLKRFYLEVRQIL